MAVYDLDGLVMALLGAVHKAQQAAQDQHVELANRYFVAGQDGNLVAKSVKVSLPSMARPGETEVVEVPLITLIPISSMMIKEVEFQFNTYIAEISSGTGELVDSGQKNVEMPGGKVGGESVKIGLGGGWNLARKNRMKVSVKIQATDPPEGVMRVNDRILKQLP
jgi:hypothetical protein